MNHPVKILKIDFVTHNVKRFVLEKPAGYRYLPGQATEVAIDLPGWREQKRPFTFTSLNDDLVLELIIKGYPERRGVTQKLHQLKPSNRLLLDKPWGTIQYQGPGVFLAGGAGITPFIAIFRQLFRENKLNGSRLFFANKTAADIILEKELKKMFADQAKLVLSRENIPGWPHGRIDQSFLKENIDNFKQKFYLCGPKSFVSDIKITLIKLGAKPDTIVFEK